MPTQVLSLDDAEQLIRSTALAVVSEYQRKRVPPIMTKAQLCDYVQKPISTINRWMKEGLPFKKEGNEYPEFYKPHVDAWLEERFRVGIQNSQGQEDHPETQRLEQGNVVLLQADRRRSASNS